LKIFFYSGKIGSYTRCPTIKQTLIKETVHETEFIVKYEGEMKDEKGSNYL